MKTEAKEKLAFYANCPDGQKNKLFTYKVHDLSNSIDLLNKFTARGLQLKKAYHTFANGKNMALDPILKSVDGDLSGIYANIKNL
jgi:hypothetical protein